MAQTDQSAWPWWQGGLIYQVYPRSFSDATGDGVGDLIGLTQRLDHISALGADGVWISPFYPSPQADFGYDVSDYCDVDPMFGSLADFDRLVARAHALDLRIIIDLVLSHSSDQHPWFIESRQDRINPRADWYVWADPKPDGSPPNNWLSVFGGVAWTWEPRRAQYYLHNFLAAQPDLNLHSPEVQDALLAVCRFWLDRGVDGFRLDVANFYTHDRALRDNPPRHDVGGDPAGPEVPFANPYLMQRHIHDVSQPETLVFLKRLRALLDEAPGRVAIAEIVDDEPVARTAAYTAPGLLHTAYNFSFLGRRRDPPFIAHVLDGMRHADPDVWPAWAFSNHDVARVVTRWGGTAPPPGFARLMLALLASLRGTLFLYQGEELGLPEAEVPFERLRDPYGRAFWPSYKGRDGARTPMPWRADAAHGGFSTTEPWLPVPTAHLDLAVDRQVQAADSTLAFAQALFGWRKRCPALRSGTEVVLEASADRLVLLRSSDAQSILCAFNLSPTAGDLVLPRPGRLTGPDLGAVAIDEGRLHLRGWAAAFVALM